MAGCAVAGEWRMVRSWAETAKERETITEDQAKKITKMAHTIYTTPPRDPRFGQTRKDLLQFLTDIRP